MGDNSFPKCPAQQNLVTHPGLLGLEHMEGKEFQNIQGPKKFSGHYMGGSKKNLQDTTFLKEWQVSDFPSTTAEKGILVS